MHRQHRANLPVKRIAHEVRAQVHGCERAMPIVRVHDHRRVRCNALHRGERGEREECIPARIVWIIVPVLAVQPRPIEKMGMVDEIDSRSSAHDSPIGRDLPEPRLLLLRTELHRERLSHLLQIRRYGVHLPVERHDDRRRYPGRALELGEALHRFAQSTGSSERCQLRDDVDHRHDAAVVGFERRGRRRRRRFLRRCAANATCGRRGFERVIDVVGRHRNQ